MSKLTFAEAEFEHKKRKTRRELFLARMDALIPWQRLERNGLGKTIFKEINAHLNEQGLQLREGTIMDVAIIAEPNSTKNKVGERDPEMHQPVYRRRLSGH